MDDVGHHPGQAVARAQAAAGRVAKALLAVSVLGAVIGLVRRLVELSRADRATPGVGAATVTQPPPDEGCLSAGIARWVPSVPRTRGGRLLAALNAAPLTLVGGAVAATTNGVWQWDRTLGCWVVSGITSGPGVLQQRLGYQANAIGQVVLSHPRDPSAALLAHEAVHVRHAERIGLLLVPLYAVLWARWGYRDHPLERAARLGAARATKDS